MQLLSSHLCAATPLHRLPACSFSSGSATQRRTAVGACSSVDRLGARWRRGRSGRSRLCAQPQEGVDRETVNVTDLRNAEPPSAEAPEPEPASYPYGGGLSEEEIREALLFEQGGDDEGPRLEDAARMAEGEPGVEYERTIPIPMTRGKGATVASFLTVFKGLLDRPYGTGASVAATGSAVIERVQDEVENLKQDDAINEQLLFEVIRVTRLLEMDMKLISAAHKESTLLERLDAARNHCQDAILLANAL